MIKTATTTTTTIVQDFSLIMSHNSASSLLSLTFMRLSWLRISLFFSELQKHQECVHVSVCTCVCVCVFICLYVYMRRFFCLFLFSFFLSRTSSQLALHFFLHFHTSRTVNVAIHTTCSQRKAALCKLTHRCLWENVHQVYGKGSFTDMGPNFGKIPWMM